MKILSGKRGEGLKVELDRDALFALASDTRLEVLRSLRDERRTLSQLAERLTVDKAAVHRHLRKLEEGGLVKRSEEHGFVYYSLTWKARGLISPGENTRVVVLLSSAVLLMVICAAILVLASSGVPGMSELTGDSDPADSPITERVEKVQSVLYWIVIAISIAAAISIILALGIIRRPRQPWAEKAEDWDGPEENGTTGPPPTE